MRRFAIWSLVILAAFLIIVAAMGLEGLSSVRVVNIGHHPVDVMVRLGPKTLGETTIDPGSSHRWFYLPEVDADYQVDCKSNNGVHTHHLGYVTSGMALLSRIAIASCDQTPSESSIDWFNSLLNGRIPARLNP